MRRGLLMLLVAGVAAAVLAGAGGKDEAYRVDAIFSNAAGLIPGQNVQIAGAVVGQVADVKLTRDHRARVQMEVRTGFAPFRANAECEIKPQSLIGEKFVSCDPGTPGARELRARGGAPLVPLGRTHAPVDIDLIFAALREPYVNRLSLVVNELGTGLAGRPHDLQLAIRRAAPALAETDRVLRIVNRDRALLGRLIERTDSVLAEVAPRDREVTRFVERAGRVSREVAARRAALGAALDRLPRLLAELEPSAASLASVSRDARPVVRELSRATPSLRSLFSDLSPLTSAGRPALAALRSASDEGRRAVRAARPVAARLKPAVALLPHVTTVAAAVTRSLRETGAVEGIQTFVWLASAATARFDATSHIVPSYQLSGTCNAYATTPADGCSAHWAGSPAAKATAAAARKHRRARKHTRRARRGGPDAGDTAPGAPDPRAEDPERSADRLPALPRLPDLPDVLPGLGPPSGDGGDSAEKLLDFLMGS